MTCPRCGSRLLADLTCLVHGEPRAIPIAEPISEKEAHELWTPEELDVLAELSERTDIKGIEIPVILAERLGVQRTYKSTKHTLARRGIHKQRYRGPRAARLAGPALQERHHRRWTEEELWALESGELQTLYHGRTRCAVYYQRYRTEGGMREDGALSIREAASLYHLPPMRVCRLVRAGTLPAQRLSPRLVRIDPLDAERVLSPLTPHPWPAPARGGVGSPMRAAQRGAGHLIT